MCTQIVSINVYHLDYSVVIEYILYTKDKDYVMDVYMDIWKRVKGNFEFVHAPYMFAVVYEIMFINMLLKCLSVLSTKIAVLCYKQLSTSRRAVVDRAWNVAKVRENYQDK